MNSYTPTEAIELVSRTGVKKGNMQPLQAFLSAVSAGCLLSFASASFLVTNTAPWYQENAPGLVRMLGALVFPYGLVLIILTGADLCTGSFLYTTVAVLQGRLQVAKMLSHWALTFWGNLAGSLFMVTIIFGYGDVFSSEPYLEEVHTYVTKKQIKPEFHQIFIRGIGCNWLVCLACFLGIQGRDLASKVVGIWWPVFGFVGLGFDHVVANMFFVPMGIWLETPGLDVRMYIWKGILPAWLGNCIGGALFVSTFYWYMHIFDHDDVAVDGVCYKAIDSEDHIDREKVIGIRQAVHAHWRGR